MASLVFKFIPYPALNVNVSARSSATILACPIVPVTANVLNVTCAGLELVIVTSPVAGSFDTVIPEPCVIETTPVLVNVTPPEVALAVIPVPAALPVAEAGKLVVLPTLVTPVLVTVIFPVALLTEIAVPAINCVTPEFSTVIVSEAESTAKLIPVPDSKFTSLPNSVATTEFPLSTVIVLKNVLSGSINKFPSTVEFAGKLIVVPIPCRCADPNQTPLNSFPGIVEYSST